jgi:hypothetical protein
MRAGYDYMFARTAAGDANLFTQAPYPAGYGFNSGVTAAQPLFGGLPQIVISSFSGYSGAGGQSGFRGPDGQASFIDNVSYLRGKHSFKFGFQFMDNVYDNNALHHASGEVKFKTLQDFLTGTVHNGTILVGNPYEYVRAHWFSGFFQDDYRITPRVTLNLGLRWEYAGSPMERFNYEATFNPSLAWPVQQVGGSGMPPMYNGYYKSFSPRVGVAWDVRGNGKTVVRASGMVLGAPELVGQYVGVSPFGANVPDLGINTSGTQLNIHTPEMLTPNGCKTPVWRFQLERRWARISGRNTHCCKWCALYRHYLPFTERRNLNHVWANATALQHPGGQSQVRAALRGGVEHGCAACHHQ